MGEAEQCKNCRYFKDDDGLPDGGDCRRYPPAHPAPMTVLYALADIAWITAGDKEPGSASVYDPEGNSTKIYDAAIFPTTWHDSWCGEYQMRPDPLPQPPA